MTFTLFLKESNADADTIQQAFRLYLSERTDDLTPEEMRTRLRDAASDRNELERKLKELEQNSVFLEQAALACFEHAWSDESQRPAIRSAFQHAKSKLPVIEVGLLSLAAMYGMYLIVTGGVTQESEETERKSDGTTKTKKSVKREGFAPVAAIIGKLFGKAG